jgi:hypothetical protein
MVASTGVAKSTRERLKQHYHVAGCVNAYCYLCFVRLSMFSTAFAYQLLLMSHSLALQTQMHGRVESCVVYERPVSTTAGDAAVRVIKKARGGVVRIFVQFVSLSSARATLDAIDGRFFGGRRVRASFFGEERFASRRDLAGAI